MKYKVTWVEIGVKLEKTFRSLREAKAFKKYLLKCEDIVDKDFVVIWKDGWQVQ